MWIKNKHVRVHTSRNLAVGRESSNPCSLISWANFSVTAMDLLSTCIKIRLDVFICKCNLELVNSIQMAWDASSLNSISRHYTLKNTHLSSQTNFHFLVLELYMLNSEFVGSSESTIILSMRENTDVNLQFHKCENPKMKNTS